MSVATIERPATVARSAPPRCRLCTCLLGSEGDDVAVRLCSDCKGRPEARAFRTSAASTGGAPGRSSGPRPFTAADKSLIAKLQAHLPAADLLRILNERLVADVGAGAVPYTLEQLHAEVRQSAAAAPSSAWSSLRRVLTEARRSGVLAACSSTAIDDFAVVWQLSPAQVTHLRDVIRHAREDS